MRESSPSPKLSPSEFEPELISTLRSVLDDAANQNADRTPAIKAKMAETILRAASEGITEPEVLKAAAIKGGMRSAD
jgi:hypothetical protein